jgi:hypothetical protein
VTCDKLGYLVILSHSHLLSISPSFLCISHSLYIFLPFPSLTHLSSKASRQAESAPASRHGSATSTFAHTHSQMVPCSTERGEAGEAKRSSVNKMMSSLIKKLNFGPSHGHPNEFQNQGPGYTADSSAAVSRGEEG